MRRRAQHPSSKREKVTPMTTFAITPGTSASAFMAFDSNLGSADGSSSEVGNVGSVPMETDAFDDAPILAEAQPIKLVALGDVHKKWGPVQQILDHEFPEGNGVALSVGDLISYPPLENGHRILFTHGNHENFGALETLHEDSRGQYQPIFAGQSLAIGGLTLAGIPGIFLQRFYDNPDLTSLKYFTRSQVETMRAMERSVDILLMHDAPSRVGFQKNGTARGDPLLTGIIEYLRPRLVLFGHHHQSFQGQLGETRIVGLDYPHRSYGVIEFDPKTELLRMTRHNAKLEKGPGKMLVFHYAWQSDKNVGGSEVLFKGRIAVGREQELQEQLITAHRDRIIADLKGRIQSGLTTTDADTLAQRRATLAVNSALPFAARYAAAIEKNPNMSKEEKEDLLKEIYCRMCTTPFPEASDETLLAFQEALKALGMVQNIADRPSQLT